MDLIYEWRGRVENAEVNLLDTLVAQGARRQGIGSRMLRIGAKQAQAARCEWLHVDVDDELVAFYIDACGFKSTPAGLIEL